MVVHQTDNDLLQHLRQVIELPERLVYLQLSMGVDMVPTITCTYYPEERRVGELPVTRKYRLEEIKPEDDAE